MRPLCSFGSGSRTRVRLRRTESCFACGECSTPTVSGLLRKRGVLCPLCFLVGTVGVYTCAPECTNHFGSKGSESGTRRGLVPDDGKAEKHARRKSEPASDARGAWFFARATRRRETNKMRGSCAPSVFWSERSGLHLRPRVHEPLRGQGFRVRNTPGACSGRRKSRKTWVPKRRAGEACAEPLVFARGTRRDAISKRGSCAPSVFLVGTVGVYTCAPECTNHFGGKGS